MSKNKKDYEEKYTDPELREKLKEEIKESDKGGKPGQWSARKSQLLAREYEKQGGGYKGEKDESQKHLEEWTEEEWQTKEGEANARGEDGETKRYLPKKAWEEMSEEEKEETERRKREGSKQGKQHVGNTKAAKKARKGARGGAPVGGYDDMSVDEAKEKLEGLSEDELKGPEPTRRRTRTARPWSAGWTARSRTRGTAPAKVGAGDQKPSRGARRRGGPAGPAVPGCSEKDPDARAVAEHSGLDSRAKGGRA
nr:hypothetical protein [Rubrobacter marinus]